MGNKPQLDLVLFLAAIHSLFASRLQAVLRAMNMHPRILDCIPWKATVLAFRCWPGGWTIQVERLPINHSKLHSRAWWMAGADSMAPRQRICPVQSLCGSGCLLAMIATAQACQHFISKLATLITPDGSEANLAATSQEQFLGYRSCCHVGAVQVASTCFSLSVSCKSSKAVCNCKFAYL